MSHPEMLTEIDRVSGPATRLREIRATLPTGRTRRPAAARAQRATREGRPAAARAPLLPRRPARSLSRSA